MIAPWSEYCFPKYIAFYPGQDFLIRVGPKVKENLFERNWVKVVVCTKAAHLCSN